jgi:hypothetical protein
MISRHRLLLPASPCPDGIKEEMKELESNGKRRKKARREKQRKERQKKRKGKEKSILPLGCRK